MQFISIYFIFFMCLLSAGFYLSPKKFKYLFLLACNMLYYLSWVTNWQSVCSLIAVVLVTWAGAFLINRSQKSFVSSLLLTITIIVTIGSLVYFKYAQFFFRNFNYLFSFLGIRWHINYYNAFMPIGISFYTFQSLSYVFEVYKKKMDVEKNFLLYGAYVTFFPVILSGPIERPQTLLGQLRNLSQKSFSFDNFCRGVVLTIWGGYIKYVIVDRFSVIVNTVFDSCESYGTVILCFGAVCYTLQIYCDFMSYSVIALGLGKMLGLDLTENFKAPYFSGSIREFWRRWHISLSTWFRDYVYIPLGGSRCCAIRKNCNLFITFLVSGLWHGADWTYILWGMIHGLYQIIGNITAPLRKRLYHCFRVKQDCFSFRLGQRVCTFVLVTFAWIFFRADSMHSAIQYITGMVKRFDLWNLFNHSIYQLGLDVLQMNILLISFIIVLFVDYVKYKTDKNLDVLLFEQNYLFYCIVILFLFFSTLIFGMYGPEFHAQDFIYFQF